tara:strand:- start:84 stop:758 length:675 start_codon:yes stop_codon:yes gene_type:complete
MQVARATGREAASRKYDILSALMAYALSQDKIRQRQIMRLMSLITTRYNWQRDELCMGQREMARLWSVDERTVKREIAKLRSIGWLVQKRKGARGRISTYGFDMARMMDDTRPAWPLIGEDFVDRLDPRTAQVTSGNVVAFKVTPPQPDGTVWRQAQAHLHAEDGPTYGAWFHNLSDAGREDGCLTLAAPTRFHATYVETHLRGRLLSALRLSDPSIRDVRIFA